MASRRRRKRQVTGGLLGRLSGKPTDPRRAGGAIDDGLVDPDRAVLLAEVGVAEVGMERDGTGEVVAGIEVRGRINGTSEEARLLLLATPDAAALLVAQVLGLTRRGRLAPEFEVTFKNRLREASGGD